MAKSKTTRQGMVFFSIFLKILLVIFLIVLLISIVRTCSDCHRILHRTLTIVDSTGYLPDDENWDIIPDTIPPDDDKIDSLPSSFSLEQFFPPIGDQGRYGTCVAWAVGYNLKTALNAIENNWSSAQLADPANQTSPKDLWMGIPSDEKGSFCQGTCFASAFTVGMEQGISNMKEVPYNNLGTCRGRILGDASNKFGSFHHIPSPTVKQLKAYITDTMPLVISANLGDKFMSWNSSQVLTNDNYVRTGMHASHAMVLVGYDDGRNAFRIRNSWGPQWGDYGSIWVDYDFFMNGFCSSVFIGEN